MFPKLVLKRGFTKSDELWRWRKTVMDGKTQRRSGSIVLHNEAREPALRWNFREGWPSKLRGPGAQRQEQRGRDREPDDQARGPGVRRRVSATADQERPGYAHRTPGVHFEWLDRPRAIAELRTDVAGFVGIAARGPLHEPVRVESWNQYTSTFGAHLGAGYLAYAVEAFFANGGRTCWVVRAADPAAARRATLRLEDDLGNASLELVARTPGTWAHDLTVTLTRLSPDRFALALRSPDGASEVWRNLSMDPGDARYVVAVLAGPGGSRLVEAVALGPAFPAGTPNARSTRLRFGTGRLADGHDGLSSLEPRHLSGDGAPPDHDWGLRTLERVDEVAIVAMPDAMPKPRIAPRHRPPPKPRCEDPESEPLPPAPDDAPAELPPAFDDDELLALQLALVRHCAELRDRFAVLDARPADASPDRVLAWRAEFDPSSPACQYAALYYPWVSAPDPLRLEGPLRAVPPSGHVAGIYARSDLRVGVHKPPANETLENCNALTASTDDAAHGDLNEAGVNVIRTLGARIRLSGARTLSSDPSWRYVNVRRLLSMIEEAIDEGTAWSVFEPNAQPLWREIDRVARSFLDGLWRRGMLDGATPDEAYLVRCDESTNPPEQRDLGRMGCLVGVLPPWPAEFVIVRIGATQGAARGVPDAETPGG